MLTVSSHLLEKLQKLNADQIVALSCPDNPFVKKALFRGIFYNKDENRLEAIFEIIFRECDSKYDTHNFTYADLDAVASFDINYLA